MVDVPAGLLGSVALAGLAVAGAVVWRWRRDAAGAAASAATQALTEEAASAGVWSEDLRRGTVTWSSGTFRILGLDPTREQPRSLDRLEYLLSGHREATARAIAAIREGEATRTIEVQLRRPDGALRDLSLSMRGVTDKKGRPVELAGVIIDVTRLRTA